MINLFLNKNQKQVSTLDAILNSNLMNYIACMKHNYEVSGMKFDDNERQRLIEEYDSSLYYFKSYLESTFSDQVLSMGNALSINEEEMISGASHSAKSLFFEHSYNGLIYVNDNGTYPHIHTDGKVVTEMEGFHILKGLKPILQKAKFNEMFTGLTVEEVTALLEQMNLLQGYSELKVATVVNHNFKEIRSLFMRGIIFSLLNSDSPYRVTRARLFADTYGIDFDFTMYENELETQKVLNKTKDC